MGFFWLPLMAIARFAMAKQAAVASGKVCRRPTFETKSQADDAYGAGNKPRLFWWSASGDVLLVSSERKPPQNYPQFG